MAEASGASLSGNRNFRLHLSASALSNLGDGVAVLALPWLAATLSRDPILIALVAAAPRVPWIIFGLPAGVWTDRADLRLLTLRADIARTLAYALVAALALSAEPGEGPGPILLLAAIAFLIGTAEVLRDNAAQTMLPRLVARGDLERANGRLQSVEQVAGQFAGPPLAGALIGAGVAVPFGFDTAAFAGAALLVWLIALPRPERAVQARFWEALSEGIGWVRRSPVILRLAVMLGAFNFLYTAALTMMVLYGQEVLGLDAFGFGLLLTAGAAGGVTGGLAAPAIAARMGARGALLLAIAMFSGAHLALALTSDAWVAGAILFADAFGGVLWNVITVSYRQRAIPGGLLGRVNAIYRFIGWGMMPLGAMAGGALVAAAEGPLGRSAALHLPFLVAAAGGAILLAYAVARLRLDPP